MYVWQWLLLGVTTCGIASVSSEGLNNPRVSIKRCCPSGLGLLSNHNCVPHETEPFAPSIYINDTAKSAEDVSSDESWDSVCDNDQVLKQLSLDNEAQLHLFEDEILLYWLSPRTDTWELVESYCVATSADENVPDETSQYVVEFCYEDPMIQWKKDESACQNATCVRKCCPQGEIYNVTCQPPSDDATWMPVFHSVEDHNIVSDKPSDLLIVYGNPLCPVQLIYDEYFLLKSGELHLPGFPEAFPSAQYCLDTFILGDGMVTEKAVVCHRDEYEGCWWRHFIVDTLFMSISCVFLAITWLVYVCIPELRTNTHGRCMISFITALFVAFVTILINRGHRESFTVFQCSLTAVLSHMSILATFFWLNVLCYHIWNCLRSGRKSDENHVFLAYSVYGWGCPLIIALTGVILDATQADVLRPDFFPPHCWFNDRITKWVYLYGFMLALIIVNLTFFLMSAVMVTRRLRQTQDMRHHSDGLWLYLKLFIIMGIMWLMEMISWMLDANPCTTWVAICDSINALHGVYIFLVTVCFRGDLKIFRRCCRKVQYDVDGNTVSCTRDNFVELVDGQTKARVV